MYFDSKQIENEEPYAAWLNKLLRWIFLSYNICCDTRGSDENTFPSATDVRLRSDQNQRFRKNTAYNMIEK